MVVDELVTLISLRMSAGTITAARSFGSVIGKISLGLSGVGVALGTVGVATTVMAGKTSRAIASQSRFAKSIGVTFNQLQQYQFAGKQVGATSDEMASSLKTLSSELNPQIPGEYNRILYLMNIRTHNAAQGMLQLADRFSHMRTIQAQVLGQKIGLSPNVTRLLQTGRKHIEALLSQGKTLGAFLPRTVIDNAIAYDKSIGRLSTSYQNLKNIVSGNLAQNLTQINDSLTKFIADNKQIISSDVAEALKGIGAGFHDIGMAAAFAGKAVSGLLSVFNKATGSHVGISKLFEGLTVAAGAGAAVKVAKGLGAGAALRGAGTLVRGAAGAAEVAGVAGAETGAVFGPLGIIAGGALAGLGALIAYKMSQVGAHYLSGAHKVGVPSHTTPFAPHPHSSNATTSNPVVKHETHVTINQSISGSDSTAIARDSARQIEGTLSSLLHSNYAGFNRAQVS